MTLISAKDDKEGEVVGVADGSVEAVVWSEKAFADNEPTLSSNAHVLFIGDNFFESMDGYTAGVQIGDQYIQNINQEIDALVKNLNSFQGFATW